MGVEPAGTVQRWRKKPVEVEARQLTNYPGDNARELADWCGGRSIWGNTPEGQLGPTPNVVVETLEGTMYAAPGDWIIRGVKGEFYPCKPDIFAATYERVEPRPVVAAATHDDIPEAVEAAYVAVNSSPRGVVVYRREIREILLAGLPVLRAQVERDIRQQIISELRAKFGVTNRAADWIARGSS